MDPGMKVHESRNDGTDPAEKVQKLSFENRAIQFLRKEGVLIACGTAAAYFITYSFERGVCKHYGIREELISLTIQQFLRFATIVGFFLAMVFFVVRVLISWIVYPKTVKEWFLDFLENYGGFALLALAMGTFTIFVGAWTHGLLLLSLGLLTMLFAGLRRYATHYYKVHGKEFPPAKVGRFHDDSILPLPRFLQIAFLALMFAIWITNIVVLAGEAHAGRIREYAITNVDGKAYIVARIYDGVLYSCPYFEKENEFGREVRAIKADSSYWTIKHTGSLNRRKARSP